MRGGLFCIFPEILCKVFQRISEQPACRMCLQEVSTRDSRLLETPALAGGPEMAVERVSGGSSLIDVLDRVLDKGIVVDAWVRISMVGIDLLTAGTRVEVASIETCLHYA